MKLFAHLIKVINHKFIVLKYCFKCRLYWQGIIHDLSKFSLCELKTSKYYQGHRSPIGKEKLINGYSLGYLHHKGRNKHHFEYWTDFFNDHIVTIRMPYRYAAEMVIDMLAAGINYNAKKWNCRQPLEYIARNQEKYLNFLHPDTYQFMMKVFSDLANSSIKRIFNSKYLKKAYQESLNNPKVAKINYNSR